MANKVNVFDHISVTVSDMDRSLAFYRDMLGLEEIERHRHEGYAINTLAAKEGIVMDVVRLQAPETPGLLLDLQQYIAPEGGFSNAKLGDVGHSHICYGVPDVWAAYREYSEKGVKFISEPVRFDLDFGVLHVVWFYDPDGSVLELVQYPIGPPED